MPAVPATRWELALRHEGHCLMTTQRSVICADLWRLDWHHEVTQKRHTIVSHRQYWMSYIPAIHSRAALHPANASIPRRPQQSHYALRKRSSPLSILKSGQ
jgi:hypothetical protein